jgi:DNA-binding transcriptional LysR family regulator
VLRLAEAAQHAARSASERNRARLRVGYVPDVLPSSVPRALQHLAAAAAGIEIALETGTPLGLIAGVRDGAVDAAVVSLPAATKGLRVTTLEAQPLIVALPSAHARALDDAVALEQLDPERLIVLERAANPALHDAVVSLCRAAGVAPALVEAAESRIEAVLLAVAAGGGAALLPRSVGDRYAVPGVRLIELLGDGPMLESAVVTRPDVEHLGMQAFLRAVTYAAKPRPALRRAA